MMIPVAPETTDLTTLDAVAMAVVHAEAFDTGWEATVLGELLSQTGVFGLGVAGAGFILCRVVADEAEILTLATVPKARRQGLGRHLVQAALNRVTRLGAERLFLEVAEDNLAARGLYDRSGFVEVGRRRGYYARASGKSVDALVLECARKRCLPTR